MTYFTVVEKNPPPQAVLVRDMKDGTVFKPVEGYATRAKLMMRIWASDEHGYATVALDGSGHTWDAGNWKEQSGIPVAAVEITIKE